jgi:hypothetical protein
MKRAYPLGLAAYLIYLFAFTLAPFDLRPGGRAWALWEPSRYDLVVNLFLFIPFGGLIQRLRPAMPLAAAILLSSTLSVGVELAQSWTPQRYPSFSDVFLNLCGGVIGFVAVRATRRRFPDSPLFSRYRYAIARIGLLFYLSILLFMFLYVRFSPLTWDSFPSKAYLWLWRAVPFRLFVPTQRAVAFFFFFWPLGVLLAASLGAPSPVPQIRRLQLSVVALLGSLAIFAIQMTRPIGLLPFVFERVALAAALALTFGVVCGGWVNRPVHDANGENRPDQID